MEFNVHILGCGSSLPTGRHLPSAQIVQIRSKLYMIDCGEGAQRQMRKMRLSFNKLVCIFITHLHGDHCFGLPGLLSSLAMLGRKGDLHLFGPVGLRAYIEPILSQFCASMAYQVIIHEYDTKQPQLVWEDKSVSVSTLPLEHRIPTQGYVFREKTTERHLDKASADFYGVPRSAYPSILSGADYVNDEGETIPNSRLTKPGQCPRSYAYCSDTLFLPHNAPLIGPVDLLYHEATFLSNLQARALQTGHSTAKEAGQMAQLSGAKRLLIGHYSARYTDFQELLNEARHVFPNTDAAEEGLSLHL